MTDHSGFIMGLGRELRMYRRQPETTKTVSWCIVSYVGGIPPTVPLAVTLHLVFGQMAD
jgi:hypothetical protein